LLLEINLKPMKMKEASSLFVAVLLLAVCANAATIPLNGPWFTGAATGSNPTTRGTPSITNPNTNTFSWGTGPSDSGQSAIRGVLWTYFPTQSLASDGDVISVTFTMRVTDTLATGIGANGFRFGLFDSAGSRLTSNLVDVNTDLAFSLSLGYSAMWSPSVNPTTMNSSIQLRDTGNSNPLSTGGATAIQTLARGADILAGIPRQASLTITRNSATEYKIESKMDAELLSGTTTSIVATNYDFFVLLNTPQAGRNNSLDFTDFTVHFIPGWRFAITSVDYDPNRAEITLQWNSKSG